MSAVSEWVVREYFEQLGYLVNQPAKHVGSKRPHNAGESVDLLIVNPSVAEHRIPDHLVWSTEDLSSVGRAILAVRGWHTERFYANMFEKTPELLSFLEPASLRFSARMLGTEATAHILCIPRLPASGALKDKTIAVLRRKGVHGILSFETILRKLIDGVLPNRNYEKSDLLQIIRLIKVYGFLRDEQLDLFGRARGMRKSLRRASVAPGMRKLEVQGAKSETASEPEGSEK